MGNNDYEPREISASDAQFESEVRQRILERKAERRRIKMRRRRIIFALLAAVISAVAGIGIGRFAGNQAYTLSLKDPISITADMPIVREAVSQIGNKGGEPFWSWYGFGSREEWCACFASWVEDQCGYIESGSAPKFAMVRDGANWFLERDQWKYGGEVPDPGDLIFFDWNQSGSLNHVGIVTAVIDDNVYTIEGNSSDRCRRKRYKLTDKVIYGYGHIIP